MIETTIEGHPDRRSGGPFWIGFLLGILFTVALTIAGGAAVMMYFIPVQEAAALGALQANKIAAQAVTVSHAHWDADGDAYVLIQQDGSRATAVLWDLNADSLSFSRGYLILHSGDIVDLLPPAE